MKKESVFPVALLVVVVANSVIIIKMTQQEVDITGICGQLSHTGYSAQLIGNFSKKMNAHFRPKSTSL